MGRGYASYERAFMRLLFGLMVFRAQRELFAAQAITVPNGLARLFHLDFLRAGSVITLCEIALPIALAMYILRWRTGIALVFLALISTGYGSINNSQGAIGHTYQIVSLVLLVQMAAQFCERWRNRARSMTDAALSQKNSGEHRLISWSQQMIVATYVVSGLAKIIKTHGMWFTTSPAIALQIVKSTDQLFYNTLDPKVVAGASAAANLVIHHPTIAMFLLGAGLLLELGAPLMLYSRLFGLVVGCAFVVLHRTLGKVMGLDFIYNQLLVLIYFVNVPYWIVTLGQKLYPHVRRLVLR